MLKPFEPQQYDLVKTDKVRIDNYDFGHNKSGSRDVWIERNDHGERFLSQLFATGENFAVRKEVYTGKCYILREKVTGRYWFLDMNDCGFWLHSDKFFGAQTFSGDESVKIQTWLTGFAN